MMYPASLCWCMWELRRCIKVVLPEPAMPALSQTTGLIVFIVFVANYRSDCVYFELEVSNHSNRMCTMHC
jgi:hypothetical protein